MKKALAIFLAAVMLLSLCACGSKTVVKWNGKMDQLMHVVMMMDVTDPYLYAGLVDYVFVGTVEEITKNIIPAKPKEHDDFYSFYRIHVDQNLKGELVEEITCRKMGGIRKDGTMLVITAEMPDGTLIPDSGLPQVGKQYIFQAYGQPDGSLLLTELLNSTEYSEELLADFQDYVDNAVDFERERYLSDYDPRKQ